MPERRFLSFRIDQLEQLVAESAGNEAQLREILAELGHRTVPRAVAVRLKVEKALRERETAAPVVSVNVVTTVPATDLADAAPNAEPLPWFESPVVEASGPAPGNGGNAGNGPTPSSEARREGTTEGASAPERGGGSSRPPDPPSGAAAIIDKMRLRLLDLTNRNRLLNFRHSVGSSLRVVDEVPSQILERIVTGRPMTFAPLRSKAFESTEIDELPIAAEPDENSAKERRKRRDAKIRQLARDLGINPSFDLPAVVEGSQRHHRDDELRTLMLPEDLYGLLQKLESRARTVIQETGNNVLHLIFGMVEWSDLSREQATAEDFRSAPLVLVPVRLERSHQDPDTQTWLYRVSATGEDWDTNATLQQKCSQDFGLEFPAIGDEEKLEHYFARVEQWLRDNRNHWKLRRQVTLSLVSFGKILMWKDLDPSTWPKPELLLDNPLLGAMLGLHGAETGGEQPARLTEEYPIDDPQRVGMPIPPIVLDADSSQHSVLVDAIRGGNLVVQGPPGTGKSQTIANLIACQIARGRRVLFVAEKKAAIDVVYRRLSGVGLASYCLQLHSHTSQKKSFLADLNTRLAIRGTVGPPRDLDAVQVQLQAQRDELNGYVRKMNSCVARLGMSGFDLLWRSRRVIDGLPASVSSKVAELKVPAVHAMDRAALDGAIATLEKFGGAARDVARESGSPLRHPWRGVQAPDLSPGTVDELVLAARAWREALSALRRELDQAEAVVGCALAATPEEVVRIAGAVASVEVPTAITTSPLPLRVFEAQQEAGVERALAAFERVEAAWARVDGAWSSRRIGDEEIRSYEATLKEAANGLADGFTLGSLKSVSGRLAAVAREAAALAKVLRPVAERLGVPVPPTPRNADRLLGLVERAKGVDAGASALRTDPLWEEGGHAELRSIAEDARALRDRRAQMDGKFPPSMAPSSEDVRRHITSLATAPRFLPSLWSKPYRQAVACFRAATGRKPPRVEMQTELRSLLDLREEVRTFTESRPPDMTAGDRVQ